jgi:2-polyprenyl-6-methoxyphenol hydroxylase-like FAD-dependent oxidoreductase
VKLLTVARTAWPLAQPGYLAIATPAHAMSPIGGLGINVAIRTR